MRNKNSRAGLLVFLDEIGTAHADHSGRSLMDHLIGTYDLLKSWNCDETICIAGGLHSVYGTNIFTKESISAQERFSVQQCFGQDAERLAWQFGSINRPKAIEQGFGIDRRCGCKISLEDNDLNSLRLIEAANLTEQGSSLQKWPNIRLTAERQILSAKKMLKDDRLNIL